jgi:activator of HSP90 ATPase
MKNYKKYYLIPAPPEDVYKALTNAATIQLWSGEPAEMEETAGTEFSLWSGSIVGKNIEFEKDRKIVQQWYFEDEDEISIVEIKLHPHKSGSSVELRHTNIPDDVFENMVEGWDGAYFGSLIDFYES